MKFVSARRDVFVLLAAFILSRIFLKLSGVSFGYEALFSYWQYLDVNSLEHNLLSSLWYQHAQPPVFNFMLGIVLKCSGQHGSVVLECLFLAITFFNTCILLKALRKVAAPGKLPLAISLLYMLSPATMLFENELFYTSFISMLLLLAMYFLIELQFSKSWISASGVFVAITLLCLTKSLYHLAWLLLAVGVLLVSFYKTPAFSKVLVTSLCSVVILTGWYAKNLVLFGSFSASSWTGMNLARIVFHDEEVKDSSSISSIPPFYPISYYKGHLPSVNLERYAGWNDKVLMDETRNGSFHNLNHAGYLQVSNKYMEAGLDYIREHPSTYLRHVATSVIIFFTPASSYFRVQANNRKIWLYDLVYSFNLSHFAGSEQDRQLSLAISAIPKFLVYLVVFTLLLKRVARSRHISAVDAFAAITILFVLTVSSCFEYGENMRFRYEVEPLFLVLAAQVLAAKIKPVVH